MGYSEEFYRRRLREENLEKQIKEEEFQQRKKENANKKPGIIDWILETNTRYYSSLVLYYIMVGCIMYSLNMADPFSRFLYEI